MTQEKTYTFVSETKRDVYMKLRSREIAFLRDPSTDRIKEELSEPVNSCLLCQSRDRDIVFEKEGFRFHRCRSCGFIYSDPQIKEDALMASYTHSLSNDAWIDVLLSDANFRYDAAKYRRGLEEIEAIRPPGRILDIGCSIGHFLRIARERGWQGVGLEMNARAAKHAREKWSIVVLEKLLAEAAFEDASFDAVTLWGVIEHLKDPCEVIREVGRILSPGGVVLSFCPNAESLVCRILHERAACFDGRNHCGYFCPRTIRLFYEKCGFRVAELDSFQPEVDTVINYLAFRDPYVETSDQPNPIKELLGPGMMEMLEQMILDRGLGYKMMVLACKV